MDIGIKEIDYWDMTVREIENAFASYKRSQRQRAYYDYTLADLIGRSVARIYNKNNKYPSIYQAYPHLYTEEEINAMKEQHRLDAFASKLKQFTNAHNKKFD